MSPKRVGVLVRPGREPEGLRMSAALTLADDEIEVLLVGQELPETPEVALQLDTLDLVEVPVLGRFRAPRVATISAEEFADRLVGYDDVLTF